MRILITGINSAVGSAVAGALAEHVVVGLGRRPHPRYQTIVCDLRDGLPPLPRFDVCLHAAFVTDPRICATRPDEARQVNVTATARLLGAAPRFVLASTGYVYGFHDTILDERRPAAPADAYAALKLAAEELTAHHPNAAILRYFFPYGPDTKPGGIVNRLIENVLAGKEIEVHLGDHPRTNPVFISDLAAATRAFCLSDARGTFNVGGAEVVSIKELAEMIGRLTGTVPRFRPTDKRIGDMIGNIEKLNRVFRPAVDLETGLRATLAHVMRNGAARKSA